MKTFFGVEDFFLVKFRKMGGREFDETPYSVMDSGEENYP
jgi:hypothetical protein